MQLTIYKCGYCQYDSSPIEWYGTCSVVSDTQATRKRHAEPIDYEAVTLDLKDLI
jgi:hypothetical protein